MALKKNGGFVLVATLWVLALLTIAAAFFAERVSRATGLAREQQDAAAATVEFANTRSEVLFLFGTQYLTHQGIGVAPALRLDDSAYRGEANDLVRLQDQRGLLNVNFVEEHTLQRFLGLAGVPLERRSALIDVLRDYTDEDSLRRLNGAEAPEYAEAGLPPPRNDWIITPHQLKSLLGWHTLGSFWTERQGERFFTAARLSGLNPNTAPPEVLAALPGIKSEVVQGLVELRRARPILSVAELSGLQAGVLETEHFVFFPSESVRITQQTQRVPWALQYAVTLTPADPRSPWRVDYYTRTVVSYAVENEAEIPKIPAWKAAQKRGDAAP